MNKKRLLKQLEIHEGKVLTPYKDSVGVTTIGIGINLEEGLREHEVYYLLESRVEEADNVLREVFPWYENLSDVRQEVLINMCFNLGIARLLRFKKMIRALASEDFEKAALEMKDSLWYKQVKGRGDDLVYAMVNNKFRG